MARRILFLVGVLATMLAQGASAQQTTTANLTVTATVTDTCVVTVPVNLVFLAVGTSGTTDEAAPAQVTVLCTSSKTGLTVTLGAGGNYDATNSIRQMTGTVSSASLPYGLYTDSGHTLAISNGGTLWSGNVTAATPVTSLLYGQIPSGAYTADAYTDTVVVTLTYN